LPKSQKQTLPRAQIESSGFAIQLVAEIADIPLDKLSRYCDRNVWLKFGDDEEYERFISVIGIGRIRQAEAQAKKAGVKFDRAVAEQNSFDRALAEIEQENIELKADLAAMKAKAFRKWVKAEEQRLGIKITNLEAAADIYDSVRIAEGFPELATR